MIIVFLRSLILYVLVIIAIRVMGKRQIGELQPSELVITILVSNIATLPLEDLNIPLITGILPILSLVCFEVLTSWLTLKSRKLRHIISGTPKVVIRNGVLDQNIMRDLRYSVDDLMTALRGNNIFDISEVQYAVVETNGSVSVFEKFAKQQVVNEDLNIDRKVCDPPVIIISDGCLIEQSLKEAGITHRWVEELLERKNLTEKDIFLLAADRDREYTLIRKKEKNGES